MVSLSLSNPVTLKSIFGQRLQYNHFVKIGNMPIIWKFPNALFVNDLLDNNGIFLDWPNLKSKFVLENNDYFKWRQLVNAIPSDWKTILARDINEGIF